MAIGDQELILLDSDPMSGGLDTRRLPTNLSPSRSPDMKNVSLHRHAVSKRGGFVPFSKSAMPGPGIRNVGHTVRTQIADEVSPDTNPSIVPDIATKNVPGRCLAGHREGFERLTEGFSVDFFFEVDDLTREWAFNGGDEHNGAGSNRFTPNPGNEGYPILYRPLISKGPSKRSLSTLNEVVADPTGFGPALDTGAGAAVEGGIQWNSDMPWSVQPRAYVMELIAISGADHVITFVEDHAILVNDKVVVSATGGPNPTIDGAWVVSAVTAKTITIPSGGTAVPTLGLVVSQPTPEQAQNGCPFAVYLKRETIGWSFELFSHLLTPGGDFVSLRMSTGLAVVGGRYHVIVSLDPTGIALFRVGQYETFTRQFAYTEETEDISGFNICRPNEGPMIVFDMPSEVVDAADPGESSPGSPISLPVTQLDADNKSKPPGLGGDYYSNSIRCEGAIDDILIRSESAKSLDTSVFDRFAAIDLDHEDSILFYWAMTDGGRRYAVEQTGQSNHLYMTPDVPIHDHHSGDPAGGDGSLWFNGETSYALADVSRSPNWRKQNDTNVGVFQYSVLNTATGRGYGIVASFSCDGIEPFEQVIAEIDGAMRIAIRPDGYVAVYGRGARSADVTGPPSTSYHLPAISSRRIKLGVSYTVVGWRTGDETRVYLNNTLVGTADNGAPTSTTGDPIGAFKIGGGSLRLLQGQYLASIVEDDETSAMATNTDSRASFLGRIHFVGAMVGSPDKLQLSKDLSVEDLSFSTIPTWDVLADPGPFGAHYKPSSSQVAGANDKGDRTTELPPGLAQFPAGHDGLDSDAATAYSLSDKSGKESIPDPHGLIDGGADLLENVRVTFTHTLVLYKLSRRDLDRVTPGRWAKNVETKFTTFASKDEHRLIYEFTSETTDFGGTLGRLLMRCSEPVFMTESRSLFNLPLRDSPASVIRGRPYYFTSPYEIGPRWSEGIAVPLPGRGSVSMLQDWKHLSSGQQFVLSGSEHSLYWARPAWGLDSPFSSEKTTKSLSLIDAPRSHVRVNASDPSRPEFDLDSAGGWNTITLSFWIKPIDLSANRMIVAKGDPDGLLGGTFNHLVMTREGRLIIAGFGIGDAWGYEETGVSIKTGAWNHVHVHIGDSAASGASVEAWVNGTPIELELLIIGGATAQTIAVGGAFPIVGDLYLGGLPDGLDDVLLLKGGANRSLRATPFHGLMSDFVSASVESTRFVVPAPGVKATPGVIPRARATDDASVAIKLSLNQGEGSRLLSEAALSVDATAEIEADDLVRIADGLEGGPDDIFDTIVYRDRTYATNGKNVPIEIIFRGLTDPRGPMDVRPMGFRLPAKPRDTVVTMLRAPRNRDDGTGPTQTAMPPSPNLAQPPLQIGRFSAFCSFVDDDFRESEPVDLFLDMLVEAVHKTTILSSTVGTTITIFVNDAHLWLNSTAPQFTVRIVNASDALANGVWTATPSSLSNDTFDITIPVAIAGAGLTAGDVELHYDAFRITGIPRSEEPHCVARQIYLSPAGGGIAVNRVRLEDNISSSIEIYGGGSLFGAANPVQINGDRLPPPRAKLISVAAGTGVILMANLPEFRAGAGSIAWGIPDEPTRFPFANRAVVDSEDGRPILAIGSARTTTFIMKRDSTWVFQLGGLSIGANVGASLRVLNNSIGMGGGMVLYDDFFYGVSDRGVYVFDGSNQSYVSDALEGIWDHPRGDDNLARSTGVFYREQSQYLAGVQLEGDRAPKRIFVMHTNVISDEGRLSFSMWDVPEHQILRAVVDPVNGRPVILMGTTSGRILRYDPDVSIDSAKDDRDLGGTVPDTAVLATELDASTFDVQTDLRGANMTLRYTAGGVAQVQNREIVFHQKSAAVSRLIWSAPLAVLPDVGTSVSFEIGGFDAYWTSAWVDRGIGKAVVATGADMDFYPADTTLEIAVAGALTRKANKPSTVAEEDFPTDPLQYSSTTKDLARGYYLERPQFKQRQRGRYVRIRISTLQKNGTGARNPWTVSRLVIRGNENDGLVGVGGK